MANSSGNDGEKSKEGVEVRARTVDEAIARGLVRLGGLSRSEVDIVVVKEGRSGLLGFGAEEALVRITPRPGGSGGTIKPAEPAPRTSETREAPATDGGRKPDARRDQPERGADAPSGEGRRSRGGRGRGRGKRSAEGNPSEAGGDNRQGARPEAGGDDRRSARSEPGGDNRQSTRPEAGGDDRRSARSEAGGDNRQGARSEPASADASAPEQRTARGTRSEAPTVRSEGGGDDSTTRRRRRRRRSDDSGPAASDAPSAQGGDRDRDRGRERPKPAPRVERARSEDQAGERRDRPLRPAPDADGDPTEIARQVVATLLGHLGYPDAVIEPAESLLPAELDEDGEDALVLSVVGERTEALLAHEGEALNALQFLARLVVNRRLGRWISLVIDVGGDRQRRIKELMALAHQSADLVESSGRPVSLPPMSAYERRIVHLVLKDRPEVATQSIGNGDRRKVTVRRVDQLLPDLG